MMIESFLITSMPKCYKFIESIIPSENDKFIYYSNEYIVKSEYICSEVEYTEIESEPCDVHREKYHYLS